MTDFFDDEPTARSAANPDAPPPALEAAVTIGLALDTVIEHGYDGPVTLGSRVAEIAANRLVRDIDSEVRRELVSTVRQRVIAGIDDIVGDLVRDLVNTRLVPTDPYGNSKGEPQTLTEVITERADKWLTAPAKNSSGYDRKSNIAALVDDAVGRAFETEVRQAANTAKAAAVAEVSKRAGEAFAKALGS